MQRFLYITSIFAFSFLFFSNPIALVAQDGGNPFELTHRLSKKTSAKKEITIPKDQNPFDLSFRVHNTKVLNDFVEKKTDNPFDIIKEKPDSGSLVKKEIIKPLENPRLPEEVEKTGFVFWFMLATTIYLALLITIYKSLIIKVYRAFTNDNILKLLHREQGTFISFPYILLYILFFINAGAFLFFTFHFYEYVPNDQYYLYLSILGITGFFIFKHLLLKIIEIIFPVQKEIRIYSFSIVIFSIILGLLLIPFNIIAAFAAPSVMKVGIYGGFLALLAVYIFRFLRGLFIASKYITFHKFHFFMYLCTVEIAPVLILIKILMNNAGIH